MYVDLVKKIIEATYSDKQEILVRNFEFRNRRNELLFFFKPECFLVENTNYTKCILDMVLQKFKQYEVEISGVLLLRGKRLEELGIMDRHYGFINKLSRKASEIIPDVELAKIKQSLGIADLRKYKLLGGHEFLGEFNEFDENSLNELWDSKKSIKIRSGFYIQKYNIKGENVVLINGFHPAQLRHFTNSLHKTVLLLLHSDTDWKILKNDLVGATFPEKAKQDSIRGEIFKNGHKYGIHDVSISNNCVHLSAGPFEALFEINNFLMDVQVMGFNLSMTNMFRLMIESGLSKGDIESCILNPTIQINEKQTDLFSFTENKNSSEAISDYLKYFVGNRFKEGQ